MSSQKIAIERYAIQSNYTKLIVKNNHPSSTRVMSLVFGGILCNSSDIPFTLNIGERKTIICSNINSTILSESTTPSLELNWTDRETSANNIISVAGTVASDLSSGSENSQTLVQGYALDFDHYDYIPLGFNRQSVPITISLWVNASSLEGTYDP